MKISLLHLEQAKKFLKNAKEFIEDKSVLEKIKLKKSLTADEQKTTNEFYRNIALSTEFIEDGAKIKNIVVKE